MRRPVAIVASVLLVGCQTLLGFRPFDVEADGDAAALTGGEMGGTQPTHPARSGGAGGNRPTPMNGASGAAAAGASLVGAAADGAAGIPGSSGQGTESG